MATNTLWKEKLTNDQLYKGMPEIYKVIRQRWFRLAGHCITHLEELAHNMVLWTPNRERENEADDRERTLTI